MTSKEKIVAEIRRIASQYGGSPPGQQRFLSETGITEYEWIKYWPRWGDALTDAGFKPNEWVSQIAENELLEKLVELCRELGHFPTLRELIGKGLRDPSFPSKGRPLRRTRIPETCSPLSGMGRSSQTAQQVPMFTMCCLAGPLRRVNWASSRLEGPKRTIR
jgi:hypothetical protein